MIDIVPYGIGFLIYISFCLVTFDTYAKNEGKTNVAVLVLIFVYYSILAGYVINLVETLESTFVKTVEMLLYYIAGGIFLFFHYKNSIKINDEENQGF